MDLALFIYHFILLFTHFPTLLKSQYTDKWTEKSLIKDLLRDYEKRARPVVDGMSPEVTVGDTTVQQITVAFGLGLIQILELDENEQILTVSVRSLYRWNDFHLVWNPEEYENITHINIPTDKIWLPDIALYNYADERLEERRQCAARVDHNGVVEWHPMAIYKSTCPVKIKYFPYDMQECNLRFGPWTFDSARVNITFYDEGFTLKDYVESPEWSVLKIWQESRSRNYPCCPEQYTDAKFYISIQRQAAYYNYILILPCFLLSSLTLVLFWLPPETPAKMVLGMNIFLAFFLLLLLLENSIPSASSSFPLIGNYYCINMTLVTLSTFLCLIVVNLHFRGDRRTEVPFWLRKLALHHGARILFVNVGPPGGPPPASEASNKMPDKSNMNCRHGCGLPNDSLLQGNSFNPKLFSLMRNEFNEQFMDHVKFNRCGKPYNNKFCSPECYDSNIRQMHMRSQFTSGSPNHKVPSCFYPDNETQMKHYSQYGRRPTQEDEQATPCSFCPACAGLAAVAAAASNRGLNDADAAYLGGQQYSMQTTPKNHFQQDPTDELAAVWEAAINESNMYNKRMSSRGLDEMNKSSEDEEEVTDDEDDEPYSTRNKNIGPDLEHFLLQCIKPGASEKAVSAANTKWNSLLHSTQPISPFYPFTSPICQDDSEDERTNMNLPRWSSAGHSVGGRGNRGTSHHSDKEINPNAENTNLWRANSSSFINPKYKKSNNDIDHRLLKRVNMVTRDVSEIVKGIRYMQKQNCKKEKNNKIIAEWRAVGMVLDRLFFVIYLCALGISIIFFFPRSGDDTDNPQEKY